MPRVRRTAVQASNVKATAYPETRTPGNQQAVTPEMMKDVMFRRPPTRDTWGRTRFGRSLNVDRIESALRGAQYGAMRDLTDLARETVATDPHLAAVLSKRINAVASLPFDIVAADGPGVDPAKAEANAELVRVQLARLPHFRQALKQLAWAFFDGRAALEIQWLLRPTDQAQKTGGPYNEPKQDWVAADLLWIHPRRLQFGPERELRVSDEIATTGFQPVGFALNERQFKFIEFKPQLFGDYPELEGLAPRCLYWSFFKRYGARDRNILMELFGKPWRVIEVDEESTAGLEDLRDAEMAADQLGGTNTARMPRGTTLKTVAPGKNAGEVHAEVIAYSDEQVSKLVLGQTGTTDAHNSGLGSNQPEVMQSEQLLILQGDAELLSDAVEDGLTDAIIALNRGVAELINAPRFVLRAEMPTDRTKEAQRVKAALDAGLELSADEAYEVTGFRKPVETDATLRVMDVAGPDGVSTARAVLQPPAKQGDETTAGINTAVPTNAPAATDPATVPPGGKFSLAPTDLASVVQVNEARASAGLGPLMLPTGAADPDGNMTVAAYQAKHEAPKPSPFGGGAPKTDPQTPEPPDDGPPPPKPNKPGGGDGNGGGVDEPPTGDPPPEAKPAGNLPAPLRIGSSMYADLDAMIAGAEEISARYEQQLVLSMQGLPGTCELPGHVHTVALVKSVQPSTVHGTLEDIIDRGVKEAARANEKWVDAYLASIKGKHTAAQINAALIHAHESLELVQYARAVERRVSQAAMTGSLDSQWEGESEREIKPEAFPKPAAKASRVGLANEDLTKAAAPAAEVVEVEPAFTKYSYQAALKYFTEKAPIPKSTFAKLSASMKARSFTVAGLSSDASLQVAQQELARSIVEGADLREFSKRLGERFESAGFTKLNPSHAENVFRTNILDSYNIGRRAEMSQPEVLKQRPYWLIRTVKDARQRKTHGAVNDWVLRADDPFWSKGGPPWGYQCFATGTPVQGDFTGASKAWYEGKMVELLTAEGGRLTVTANHPVLTAQGFVAAHSLREGDEVLGYGGQAGVAALGQGAQGHEDHAPSTAEQVFGALGHFGGVEFASYGSEDFHGEADRFHGQIEVVGSYRQLSLDVQALSAEQFGKLQLEAANTTTPTFGGGALGGEASGLASTSPGGCALSLDGGTIATAPFEQLGGAASSHRSVELAQCLVDDLATNAELAGQLLDRSAGKVTLCKLIGARQYDFSGHVFDLATQQGWLVAGGIIASNCRCRVTSIRAARANEMGIRSGAEILNLPDEGFTPNALVGSSLADLISP